jgi:hypothetical protein
MNDSLKTFEAELKTHCCILPRAVLMTTIDVRFVKEVSKS